MKPNGKNKAKGMHKDLTLMLCESGETCPARGREKGMSCSGVGGAKCRPGPSLLVIVIVIAINITRTKTIDNDKNK